MFLNSCIDGPLYNPCLLIVTHYSSCLQPGFLRIANFKRRHSNRRIGQTASTSSQARAIEHSCVERHHGRDRGGPITGHTHSVWSVAFSPDDQRIVSYSHDPTILRVKSILKSSNCDADGLKRSTHPPSTFLSPSPLHRSCLHPRPIDFPSSPLKPVLLFDLSSSRSLPRALARPLFL
ncbi:hypothetical protein EDB85DRAFT_1581323 [Lactarius pseudohatsudake]|nr:hypothetical protein EDB85DRAFT_1581323 [Lactarius pseudohatsudake]